MFQLIPLGSFSRLLVLRRRDFLLPFLYRNLSSLRFGQEFRLVEEVVDTVRQSRSMSKDPR